MSTLHYFNPENDLALATNTPHFTPPAAALKLSHALASLPRWWSDDDDIILTGLTITDTPQPDKVLPWGWSRYTREKLHRAGVHAHLLPTDDELEDIRILSHRRLTITLHDYLSNCNLPYSLPPRPIEIREPQSIQELLDRRERLFIKSPWSGSGRGIIDSNTAPDRQVIRLAEGVIKHQGSIMVEKGLEKITDLAMLFEMVNGKAVYVGLSLFFNERYSIYAGNLVASEDELLKKLTEEVSLNIIESTADAISQALEHTIGTRYSGPLGVDMLTYRTPSGDISLNPIVEVNLRMTMGRVAHEIHRRHLSPDSKGVMQIFRGRPTSVSAKQINLVPENDDFNILLQLF